MNAEGALLDALISGRLPSSVALVALAVYVVIRLAPEQRTTREELKAAIRTEADRVIEELRDRRLSDVEEGLRRVAQASEPDRDPRRTAGRK